MRVELHGIDSVMHVVKRGARGSEIVRDAHDRNTFARSLFYLNDVYTPQNWRRETAGLPAFKRPQDWPEREPLVRILAWTLLSNHFHLVLQEIREGGIAKFMQRLGGSMSTGFNLKYAERGSLFQGGYRGKSVVEESHLNYLAFYVLVKNVLEMYPGGLVAASANFDAAWEWAAAYPYSSLREIVASIDSPIVEDVDGLIAPVIGAGDAFKKESYELLQTHLVAKGETFNELMLESW
ncbi:MAG: transposase [Minisyncoccota bacterium]